LGATDCPLFRTDLVSRPIEEAGYRFIEVTDPDSGNSFRFYEVEYAIACAMDGERDVVELADWARIELGLDASPDELRTVIGTLEDLGYLDTGAPAVAQPGPLAQPGSLGQPAPLARPPPAGRPLTGPAPFDLPAGRGNAGPAPFDFDGPAVTAGDGNAGARSFGEGSPSPVSMDLSEHIPLRAQDVKEAVRQSRVMPVVRLPEDTGRLSTDDDQFDNEQTPAPVRPGMRAPAAAAADAGRRPHTPPPVPAAALGKTLMGTPAPMLPGSRVPLTPPPMVLPDKPAEFGRPPPTSPPESSISARVPGPAWDRGVPPPRPVHASDMRAVPAPSPRASALVPYLVVLLLLALAGAGAYWWFFMREEALEGGSQGAPAAAPRTVEQTQDDVPARAPPPSPPPAPPAPAEITAALEAGPTHEREVLAGQPGRVLWLAPAGSEVSQGAPIAKLDGYQKWDLGVREAQESQRRYQEKLDQSTSRGDKEAMKEAEANVKRKQGDIDKNAVALDPFLIKAPVGGVVEVAIKRGALVKTDQPVAKILAQSAPRATFILPPGTTHDGGEARVVSKSDASLAATCKVESNEPGKLVVSCPTDTGLASGTQVVLKPR